MVHCTYFRALHLDSYSAQARLPAMYPVVLNCHRPLAPVPSLRSAPASFGQWAAADFRCVGSSLRSLRKLRSLRSDLRTGFTDCQTSAWQSPVYPPATANQAVADRSTCSRPQTRSPNPKPTFAFTPLVPSLPRRSAASSDVLIASFSYALQCLLPTPYSLKGYYYGNLT